MKNVFESSVAKWIFYSNAFVALCAVLLHLFFHSKTGVFESILLFAVAFSAYSLLKFRGAGEAYVSENTEQAKWIKQNYSTLSKAILISVFIIFISWYKTSFMMKPNWFYAIFFIAVYYAFRALNFGTKTPPILNAFLKIFNVALVWGFVTSGFSLANPFPFIGVFFLISALMIPFEIKDMKFDKNFGVATIPLLLSAVRAKWIGVGFLLLSLFFFSFSALSSTQIYAWYASCIIGFAAIYFSEEYRKEIYYLFIVDGVMCLPFLIATVVKL